MAQTVTFLPSQLARNPLRCPVRVAILPSSVMALFKVTNGRRVVMYLTNASLSLCAAASHTPTVTAIPAAVRRARPVPATRGFGIAPGHHYPADPSLNDGVSTRRAFCPYDYTAPG